MGKHNVTGARNVHLTQVDIDKLAQDTSPDSRVEVGSKVARAFTNGQLKGRERELAIGIFRLLMKDATVKVRQALSEQLKDSMELPREIARALSYDIAEVALPMLEFSFVLTEEDLIEIVRSTNEMTKLSAIARRSSMSSELTNVLIMAGDSMTIQTLFINNGASFSDASLIHAIEQMSGHDSILEALVHRGGLSMAVAEKLFAVASDEMKKIITQKYRLSRSVAEYTTEQAHDSAMLSMISPHASEKDIEVLVDNLKANNHLSLSLILRSLSECNLRFFESAMAKMADIPLSNARLLILDRGNHGFQALYEACGLPESFFPAIKIMVDIALEETAYGRFYQNDFNRILVERLKHENHKYHIEHMDYLMTVLSYNAPKENHAAAATVH